MVRAWFPIVRTRALGPSRLLHAGSGHFFVFCILVWVPYVHVPEVEVGGATVAYNVITWQDLESQKDS